MITILRRVISVFLTAAFITGPCFIAIFFVLRSVFGSDLGGVADVILANFGWMGIYLLGMAVGVFICLLVMLFG